MVRKITSCQKKDSTISFFGVNSADDSQQQQSIKACQHPKLLITVILLFQQSRGKTFRGRLKCFFSVLLIRDVHAT